MNISSYIFLFMALFFVGSFFYLIEKESGGNSWFLPFLFFAVPIIIAGWGVFITPDEDDIVFKRYRDIKIHSTAGSQYKTSGYFILGSGVINSKEMYLGNVKTEYNGKEAFKRVEIPVQDVVRIVDNNLSDIAIYKIPVCKFKKESYMNLPFEDKYKYTEIACSNSVKKKTPPLLLIPKNAIIQQMNFQ